MTDNSSFYPPIEAPIHGSQNEERFRALGLLTFDDVEDRLVEAMALLWQLPDRERGWLKVRAFWPDVRRHNHFGDYGDMGDDARPPRVPLSRAQMAAMDEALGWLDHVDPDDRRLIGMVLRRKAGGHQVEWMRLLKPMGVRHGADGLRKRYGRALAAVVKRVNATR